MQVPKEYSYLRIKQLLITVFKLTMKIHGDVVHSLRLVDEIVHHQLEVEGAVLMRAGNKFYPSRVLRCMQRVELAIEVLLVNLNVRSCKALLPEVKADDTKQPIFCTRTQCGSVYGFCIVCCHVCVC